jgi:predicted RecA/RadA family phage recombinase
VKKYRLLLALACALSAAPYGRAQIAISNAGALAFGKFAAGSGGTVTVSTSGARTSSGGVVLLSSGAGAAAAFNISDPDTGNLTKTYIITLPANGTVALASGSNSMAVNDFVSDPSGSSIMVTGTQTLTVGATLSVGANQPVGNYSGSFSVTVNYQ